MSADALEVISNFVSLVIIVNFDNFIYESMKNESFGALLSKEFTDKVFTISHTTSKKCKGPGEISRSYTNAY